MRVFYMVVLTICFCSAAGASQKPRFRGQTSRVYSELGSFRDRLTHDPAFVFLQERFSQPISYPDRGRVLAIVAVEHLRLKYAVEFFQLKIQFAALFPHSIESVKWGRVHTQTSGVFQDIRFKENTDLHRVFDAQIFQQSPRIAYLGHEGRPEMDESLLGENPYVDFETSIRSLAGSSRREEGGANISAEATESATPIKSACADAVAN